MKTLKRLKFNEQKDAEKFFDLRISAASQQMLRGGAQVTPTPTPSVTPSVPPWLL